MFSRLQNKKVLFVIAFRDFRDSEYFIPQEILKKAGAEIKVASDEAGTAIGADGGEVNIDFKLEEVNVAGFDTIVFIGGPGALERLDNEKSYNIARETVAQHKVLAAICIAPAILAKAGVLRGKKATVWASPMGRKGVDILKENGALYQKENIVQEGNIVTGCGPEAAKEFGERIEKILSE